MNKSDCSRSLSCLGFLGSSLLLLMPLFFTGMSEFPIVWLLTCAVSAAGSHRLQALAAANVLFIVFLSSAVSDQVGFLQIAPTVQSPLLSDYLGGLTVRLLAIAALVGFFSLLTAILVRTPRFRAVTSSSLGLLAVLIILCELVPASSELFIFIKSVLVTTTVLFSRFFWSLIFSLIAIRSGACRMLPGALSSLSFWTPLIHFHIGSIPRGIGELLSCDGRSHTAVLEGRRSGIYLVSMAAILFSLADRIDPILFEAGFPFHLIPQYSFEYADTATSPGLLWANNLLSGLRLFVRNSARVSLAVGLIRFAGFYVPRAQFKIWTARSFSELMNRIYFYYTETLKYFFFLPTWSVLRRLPIAQSHIARLSVFLSVLLGGIIIHAVLDVQTLLGGSPRQFVLATVGRLPYLVILAALSLARLPTKRVGSNVYIDLVRGFLLLTLYLFVLGTTLPSRNAINSPFSFDNRASETVEFLKALLGLN